MPAGALWSFLEQLRDGGEGVELGITVRDVEGGNGLLAAAHSCFDDAKRVV